MKIIAELGSNWKSLEDCKNAIHLAHAIGADAIKFQLYTHEELYGYPGLLPGMLPREWIKPLYDKATATGIEFMCTAFSVDGIKYIDPYVKTHKIASSEMCHIEMLTELIKINKPTIISTGAQTAKDVSIVAELTKHIPVTFLYCEASYPANHIDMRKMPLLKDLVARDVGFSDHTTQVYLPPMMAKDMGATILEKHFNPFGYKDTPDAPHSISTEDFKNMVRAIKNKDEPTFGPTANENDMTLKHKRRLIATQPIPKGANLLKNVNYGIYRSKQVDTAAAHPAFINNFHGKQLKVEKNLADPITPSDV